MRAIARLAVLVLLALVAGASAGAAEVPPGGTGDLGIIVERASGRVQVVEASGITVLGSVDGLGDLSHASAVFSRDGRYAYVFGRDGGLSKVDLLAPKLDERIVQSGNAIGGAISQDGTLIAVSNYEPGGVKVFSAENLALVADIPAMADGQPSKVVGLVDLPDQSFAFALYDAGEIWVTDLSEPGTPKIRRYPNVGTLPYDGFGIDQGRYYLAGLFGEDGVALLDLWRPDAGVRRILDGYGKGEEPLPVYKMPHLEGVATAGGLVFMPAVGRREVLAVDARSWEEVARIPVAGQPVFAVARPDGRQIWVNFAHPDNATVQVIDVPALSIAHTFSPGKAVMHLEFTAKGDQVWISARDDDAVRVYDPRTLRLLRELPAENPSGIFFTARGHRIGY
ncbi:MAG: cytochrome D1 domain-containing protein [Rhodospirillales bacterium]|nr:cytochrome D1 domain-containing protein [Rhodospirillales bacterium]